MVLNDYQLLFRKKNKVKRPKLYREKIHKQQYEDMEVIREKIGELPPEEFLKIKFIRNEPTLSYRVSIFKRYNIDRKVIAKDGRIVTLKPGLYVKQSWWVDNVRGDWYEQSYQTYQC